MTPMTSFLPWAKARRLVADPTAPARPAAPMALNRLRRDGLRTSPDILFSLSCNTDGTPDGIEHGPCQWLCSLVERLAREKEPQRSACRRTLPRSSAGSFG